jgi:thiol-disulfide isomerase/thioredoxin
MPKPILLFALSLAAAGAGGVVLETARSSAAQTRPPLLDVSARTPRPAPPWRNTTWLNTDRPLTLASLRGRVVLLNFWTFTCYNCRGAIPSLVTFDRMYRGQGLTLIGMHTPEFPPYAGEHDSANVAKALREHGIEYPMRRTTTPAPGTCTAFGIGPATCSSTVTVGYVTRDTESSTSATSTTAAGTSGSASCWPRAAGESRCRRGSRPGGVRSGSTVARRADGRA